jgi:parallel beta-helix repeat protein
MLHTKTIKIRKKGLYFFTIFVIIFASFNTISSENIIDNVSKHHLGENIIYVGGSGPGNFTSIQDAINYANNNDIIFVFNGVYFENIIINKTLQLIGENKEISIIDGNNNGSVISIFAKNVHIQNFSIKNSGGYNQNSGIEINNENASINNCKIFRTKIGILLNNTDKNKIENCYFFSNGKGIVLHYSERIIIKDCIFGHNSIGCVIKNSKNLIFNYNYFHTNGISCLIIQSTNIEIKNCNISDNSVNMGGIFFIDCKNVDVFNSIFKHNGAGINIFSSENLTINNCNFNLNTHFAISLRTPSEEITISKSKIINNLRYGIYIEPNNKLSIRKCNIVNNSLYGIFSSKAKCNARYNWWGSVFGPSFTEFRSSDKVFLFPSILGFFPWVIRQLEEIGACLNKTDIYSNISNMIKIQLVGEDNDNDGLPNYWEEKWGYDPEIWDDHENLDPDNDALNNFQECYTDEYGSNPFYKDIFIEIDWMQTDSNITSNKPSDKYIDRIVNIFQNHEINLHIDTGNLDGGEEIPSCNISQSFSELTDIYWNFFLHNDLNNPRKGIFRYGIICNYCPDSNFPFFGWDQLDSFAISSQLIKLNNPLFNIDRLIMGAVVHHLGHTLGLLADTYEGIDNIKTLYPLTKQWWKYHNYRSCMNYFYKYKIFTYSDGSHGKGDFDDWSNIDFGFFQNSIFQ